MVIIYDLRVEWMEYIWGDRDVARNVQGMVIIYDSRVEDIWGDDDTDKKMTAVWTSR